MCDPGQHAPNPTVGIGVLARVISPDSSIDPVPVSVEHRDRPRLRVGRSPDADIRIDRGDVSRDHLVFHATADRVWLRDDLSRNGSVLVDPTSNDRYDLKEASRPAPPTPFDVRLGKEVRLQVLSLTIHLGEGDSEAGPACAGTDTDTAIVVETRGTRRRLALVGNIDMERVPGPRMSPAISSTLALLFEAWNPGTGRFDVVPLSDFDRIYNCKHAESFRNTRISRVRLRRAA